MSGPPTSIAGAPFLADRAFAKVIAAIERDGDRARVVGGAVRNTLLGEPVSDVDIATNARPEVVTARAEAAGLKAVPTGIEHGTVTVIAHGHPFEVTTLRADLETDGRRAVVAFTDDWTDDASRRDFTMNAIYADADGTLFDPTGGVADALARRVRFIGSAEDRIREDYLRILRFFRFHARYGHGAPDSDALAACVALQSGLDVLSRERIGMEMRKLVVAVRAAETLALMAEIGILAHALGAPGRPDRFARTVDLLRTAGAPLDVPLALAALGADRPEDAERLGERLRLSNQERDTIADLVRRSAELGPAPDEAAVRLAVYRAGNRTALDALVLAAANAGAPLPGTAAIARDWLAPKFPVTGKDLLAEGMAPGPAVGKRLAEMEAAWIAAGYGDVEPVQAVGADGKEG